MYKTIKHSSRPATGAVVNTFSENTEHFHKNSYFIRGGLDLSNTELANDAQVSYDSDDELEQGTITASAISNPRISFFELVDALGAEKAMQEIALAQSGDQTDSEIAEK